MRKSSNFTLVSCFLKISSCFGFLILIAVFPTRISAQNVGIGTATPLEKLHVIGNIRSSTLAGAGSRMVLSDLNGTLINATGLTSPAWMTTGNTGLVNGTHFLGTTDNIDVRIRTSNVERITVKGTGSIGLFTNAPVTTWLHSIPTALANDFQFKWDNNLTADAVGRFQNSVATNGSRVFLGVTNYNASAFVASAVMGLSLNATTTGAGGVGVTGSANNESGRGVEGTLFFTGPYTGWAGYFSADVFSAGTYFGSDKRLKREIQPITDALSIVNRINPVSYFYDTEKYPGIGFDENRKTYGFIAQDLEQVIPELVKDKYLELSANEPKTAAMMGSERNAELFKVVNYTQLIPVLTEAIKEQQKQIDELRNRIKELEQSK